jgi:hypothetical protein
MHGRRHAAATAKNIRFLNLFIIKRLYDQLNEQSSEFPGFLQSLSEEAHYS